MKTHRRISPKSSQSSRSPKSSLKDSLNAQQQQFGEIESAAFRDMEGAGDLQELYNCKTRYLGKKGSLTKLSQQIPQFPVKDRPLLGQKINGLRQKIEKKYRALQEFLSRREMERKMEQERLDLTLPSPHCLRNFGGAHPVSQVMERVFFIMSRLGYSLRLGPAVEESTNNFDALNIPEDHPAREMQDTFFLKGNRVLRTHTSPIQVRSLRKEAPPLRILGMGAVFRRDNDISHLPHFHQIEGMCIDKKVSMADLKGTMQFLLQEFLGRQRERGQREQWGQQGEWRQRGQGCGSGNRKSGGTISSQLFSFYRAFCRSGLFLPSLWGERLCHVWGNRLGGDCRLWPGSSQCFGNSGSFCKRVAGLCLWLWSGKNGHY